MTLSVDASHNADAPRASFLVVFVDGFNGS